MSAIAQIAVADGASTPVTRNFDPLRIDGNVAHWEDRVGGIPVGYGRLALSVIPPSKQSRIYKVRLRMGLPVMEVQLSGTYNGLVPVPSKAFENGVDMTFFCPERAVESQRKDLRVLTMHLLENAIVVQALEKLANVY